MILFTKSSSLLRILAILAYMISSSVYSGLPPRPTNLDANQLTQLKLWERTGAVLSSKYSPPRPDSSDAENTSQDSTEIEDDNISLFSEPEPTQGKQDGRVKTQSGRLIGKLKAIAPTRISETRSNQSAQLKLEITPIPGSLKSQISPPNDKVIYKGAFMGWKDASKLTQNEKDETPLTTLSYSLENNFSSKPNFTKPLHLVYQSVDGSLLTIPVFNALGHTSMMDLPRSVTDTFHIYGSQTYLKPKAPINVSLLYNNAMLPVELGQERELFEHLNKASNISNRSLSSEYGDQRRPLFIQEVDFKILFKMNDIQGKENRAQYIASFFKLIDNKLHRYDYPYIAHSMPEYTSEQLAIVEPGKKATVYLSPGLSSPAYNSDQNIALFSLKPLEVPASVESPSQPWLEISSPTQDDQSGIAIHELNETAVDTIKMVTEQLNASAKGSIASYPSSVTQFPTMDQLADAMGAQTTIPTPTQVFPEGTTNIHQRGADALESSKFPPRTDIKLEEILTKTTEHASQQKDSNQQLAAGFTEIKGRITTADETSKALSKAQLDILTDALKSVELSVQPVNQQIHDLQTTSKQNGDLLTELQTSLNRQSEQHRRELAKLKQAQDEQANRVFADLGQLNTELSTVLNQQGAMKAATSATMGMSSSKSRQAIFDQVYDTELRKTSARIFTVAKQTAK